MPPRYLRFSMLAAGLALAAMGLAATPALAKPVTAAEMEKACQTLADNPNGLKGLGMGVEGMQAFAGYFMCSGYVAGLRVGALRASKSQWACVPDTASEADVAGAVAVALRAAKAPDSTDFRVAVASGLLPKYPCQ